MKTDMGMGYDVAIRDRIESDSMRRESDLNTDPAIIEARALADYQLYLGKTVLIRAVSGFVENDSVDISLDPPATVRIEETSKESVLHWNDNWLDPYWEVKLLEPHAQLTDVRSMWISGNCYHLNGKQTERSDVISTVNHGEQGKTDTESLLSLPDAAVRLNTGTGVIEITHADGAMAYLGDQAAVEQFSKDAGLSAPDKDRLLSLNSLGKQLSEANMALDDIPLVVTGRFVGPVVATKDGVAIQDTGRGNMVGHDMSKFDTPPKAGDKLDARYKNGLVRAVDELSKDNHSVSVSMHTR